MTSLFVTGTSTDVGKTWVTAALARELTARGQTVRALKPVTSGVRDGPGADALCIAEAAGHPPPAGWTFAAALSPHRAAAMEGRRVALEEVVAWIEAHRGPWTIVEGAGGWEVPCDPDWRISDLAATLRWPVLIVARNQLGSLNHTLLTLDAVRRRGLTVAGVVLNGGQDEAARTNHEDLATLAPSVALHTLRQGETDVRALVARWLAPAHAG